MIIDQAIFTSAQTARSDGYHLVATSRGIVSEDRRELRVWGPSHDSLLTSSSIGNGSSIGSGSSIGEASSVNFFPLPSGSYCVAKTVAAGPEYSGRGGDRIYSNCLVVPPEALARFGNNPFAVLYAAVAGGHLAVARQPPSRLGQIRLIGGAGQVDVDALSQIDGTAAATCCGRLVDEVLAGHNVALIADRGPRAMLRAVINCLPLSWRLGVSFATGLKHSTRRPFSIIAVENDESLHQSLRRRHGFTIVGRADDLAGGRGALGGWAAFVAEALEGNQGSAITDAVRRAGAAQTAEALNRLGETARLALEKQPRENVV